MDKPPPDWSSRGRCQLDTRLLELKRKIGCPLGSSSVPPNALDKAFCDLKQANLKVSEYVRQANDIFLGRETHPFLSQLTEGHFSFKFFMGLHPQIRLNIRLSPEALMNKAFTDLTSQAQEVGTHVENLDTRAPHQVAQMGRSGPQPSSQQTVTATPPASLPEHYWTLPITQRKILKGGG